VSLEDTAIDVYLLENDDDQKNEWKMGDFVIFVAVFGILFAVILAMTII
jgi:type IV secretory pathway component VirB8